MPDKELRRQRQGGWPPGMFTGRCRQYQWLGKTANRPRWPDGARDRPGRRRRGSAQEGKPAAGKIGKVKIIKAEDADKITVLADGSETRIALANTLPLSRWPTDLAKQQQQIKTEAQEFLKKQAKEHIDAFFLPAHLKGKGVNLAVGDVLLRGGESWQGNSPAETVGWFISHWNLLFIQQGYSVYVEDDEVVVPGFPEDAQDKRRELFRAAQQFAEQNKNGIWKDRAFAQKLMELSRKAK